MNESSPPPPAFFPSPLAIIADFPQAREPILLLRQYDEEHCCEKHASRLHSAQPPIDQATKIKGKEKDFVFSALFGGLVALFFFSSF